MFLVYAIYVSHDVIYLRIINYIYKVINTVSLDVMGQTFQTLHVFERGD